MRRGGQAFHGEGREGVASAWGVANSVWATEDTEGREDAEKDWVGGDRSGALRPVLPQVRAVAAEGKPRQLSQ